MVLSVAVKIQSEADAAPLTWEIAPSPYLAVVLSPRNAVRIRALEESLGLALDPLVIPSWPILRK